MKNLHSYYGIALAEERKGTNCWGHIEGKESCIHLKFGKPFKYYDFTPDFEKKHPEFVKKYKDGWEHSFRESDRSFMLEIWRDIISLKAQGELVVICNMCDLECPDENSIVLYAMTQCPFNYSLGELTHDLPDEVA